MRSRVWNKRWVLTSLVTLALALTAGELSAQGFDVQQLNPMPGQQLHFIGQPSARPVLGGSWEVGLVANYANDPLVIVNDEGERLSSVVGNQLTQSLLATFAFVEWFEFGLELPLIVFQDGDAPPPGGALGIDASNASFGVGDPRLVPRVVLYTQETAVDPSGLSVAFMLPLYLPFGDASSFQGEGFRTEPKVVVDYGLADGLRFSGNVGYLIRPEADLNDLEVNDSLNLGLAANIPVGGDVHVVPEISTDLEIASGVTAAQTPTELVVGVKYRGIDGLLLEGGLGTGLVPGFGTPDWRGLLGLSYRPGENLDPDGDGLVGEDDKCPMDPEDFDEFEDVDGCPDPDNDKDGILDVADKCPMDPEDFDEFEDVDGCPDLDNDKDGILDAVDKCPLEPEDIDTFEDEDGCEDPDNDLDQILDVDDKCPLEPEDIDEFEDEDGCPDPDNDNDGILDVADKCPLEPEVVNGFEDEDGCPDEGGLVEVTCDKINIKDKVFFKTGKADIQKRSFTLLDQVAGVLRSQKRIRKIRIEGHTDDVGGDAANLSLSDRRAKSVRKYFTKKGVDVSRLEAQGYGESQPAVEVKGLRGRKLKETRSKNRRVEFKIIEQDGCDK